MFEGFALGSTKNRRESLKDHAKLFFIQGYLFSGFNLQSMVLSTRAVHRSVTGEKPGIHRAATGNLPRNSIKGISDDIFGILVGLPGFFQKTLSITKQNHSDCHMSPKSSTVNATTMAKQ